jgi:hypothetical protein
MVYSSELSSLFTHRSSDICDGKQLVKLNEPEVADFMIVPSIETMLRLSFDEQGEQEFAHSMLKRLQKCGIQKSKPSELTEEEVKKFARLDIDPDSITWRRVVDTNDRFLRQVTIGQVCNSLQASWRYAGNGSSMGYKPWRRTEKVGVAWKGKKMGHRVPER